MGEISFNSIYSKLRKKSKKMKDQELLQNLLNEDQEYLQTKMDKQKILDDHEVQMMEKQIGNITYGAYMHKNSYNDFKIGKNYNIVETPPNIYYEASMVAIDEDEKGTLTLDNILAIRDKNKDIVQARYDYIVNILNTYSETEILKLIDDEVKKQKKTRKNKKEQ